jgi:hypothetical protein
MSCSKCGKKKVMNNLRNVDYINQAKEIYRDVIMNKTIEEIDDLDRVIIMETYKLLYPSSSATPSLEEAINQIKIGIEVYDVKYRR